MDNVVVFPASLFKVAVDKDGEARVQFDVPRSALGDVVQLSALTDTLLEVTVRVKAQEADKLRELLEGA